MPEDDQRNRFAWVTAVTKAVTMATLAIVALVAAGCVAMIVIRAAEIRQTGDWGPVVAYAVALLACPLLAGWALVAYGLVRVLLAEQLYRAWTVLHGHPYHRA